MPQVSSTFPPELAVIDGDLKLRALTIGKDGIKRFVVIERPENVVPFPRKEDRE